jgi:hypothetical protein
MEPTLFDAVAANDAKELGKSSAAGVSYRMGILAEAQEIARDLGRRMGHCCADQVYFMLDARGRDIKLLGNGAGSIFAGKEWEFSGEWIKSTRITNHGRMIRVWKFVG